MQVSKLGFGCRRLTGKCNESLVSQDFANSIIKHAFDKGITFFDTADLYGPYTNEILVGKVAELRIIYACISKINDSMFCCTLVDFQIAGIEAVA